jgi:excisionase family DNA binding protein
LLEQREPTMDQSILTISVPEAGRRLGLGKNLSYEAARRGELPVLRFGRKLRVPLAALERLLLEAKSKSPDQTIHKNSEKGRDHGS